MTLKDVKDAMLTKGPEPLTPEAKDIIEVGATQDTFDQVKQHEKELTALLQKNRENTQIDPLSLQVVNRVLGQQLGLPPSAADALINEAVKIGKDPLTQSLQDVMSNDNSPKKEEDSRKLLNQFLKDHCKFETEGLPSRELEKRCRFISLSERNAEKALKQRAKHTAWEIFSIPIKDDQHGGLWCFYIFDLVKYISQFNDNEPIPFPGYTFIEKNYPSHFDRMSAHLNDGYRKHIYEWAESADLLNREIKMGKLTPEQINYYREYGDTFSITSVLRGAAAEEDTHSIQSLVIKTAGSWGSSVKNALLYYTGIRNLFDWLLKHRVVVSMIRAFMCFLNIVFFMGSNLRGLNNMELIQFMINYLMGNLLTKLYNAVYGVIQGQASSMTQLFTQMFRNSNSVWFTKLIDYMFPLLSFISGISSVIVEGTIDMYNYVVGSIMNTFYMMMSGTILFQYITKSYNTVRWTTLVGLTATMFTSISLFFYNWGSYSFNDINLGTISYDWQTVIAEWLCNALSSCYTWIKRFMMRKDDKYNDFIKKSYDISIQHLKHECQRWQYLHQDVNQAAKVIKSRRYIESSPIPIENARYVQASPIRIEDISERNVKESPARIEDISESEINQITPYRKHKNKKERFDEYSQVAQRNRSSYERNRSDRKYNHRKVFTTMNYYLNGRPMPYDIDKGTVNVSDTSALGGSIGAMVGGPQGAMIGSGVTAVAAVVHNKFQRDANIQDQRSGNYLELAGDAYDHLNKTWAEYAQYRDNTLEGKAERKAQKDMCKQVKEILDKLGEYFGMVKLVADIYFNSMFLFIHFGNRKSIARLFEMAKVFDGTKIEGKESWYQDTVKGSSCITQYYQNLQTSENDSTSINIRSIHDPHKRKVVSDLSKSIREQVATEMKGRPFEDADKVLKNVLSKTFFQDSTKSEWQNAYKPNKLLEILHESNAGQSILSSCHLVGMKLPDKYVPLDISILQPITDMATFPQTMLSNLLQAGDYTYWQKIKEIVVKNRKSGMTGSKTSIGWAVREYIRTELGEEDRNLKIGTTRYDHDSNIYDHPGYFQLQINSAIDQLRYFIGL